MRFQESSAGARRIPIVIHNSSGTLAAGCVPVAGQLFVSVNGEAWRAASGTLIDRGGGAYYYQATLAEASVSIGVLCVLVTGVTGYRSEMTWAPVGDSATVRIPLVVYDTTGTLYEGFAPVGDELQTSTGGGDFQDATGDLLEMGVGGYVYVHDHDVASTSFVVVKAEAAAIQTALAHGVGGGSDVELGEPVEGTYELAEIAPIDHLEAALARLPEQFKND